MTTGKFREVQGSVFSFCIWYNIDERVAHKNLCRYVRAEPSAHGSKPADQ
nr:MAG TPA_asm: hypothetical protein [Caudoviricetes sp.]